MTGRHRGNGKAHPLRRVLYTFIGIVAVLAGVLLFAQGQDFSWALRDQVEARGQALLSRPVTISGKIAFEWRWGAVALYAEGVETEEPQSEATFGAGVTAERAGVVLGLVPLLQGEIDLRGVELREAWVTLPAGQEGGTPENQTIVPEAMSARAARLTDLLGRLRRVDIDNLHIIRERTGLEPQLIDIDHLVLAPEGEGLRGAFVGEVDGTGYDVEGHLENLASFLRQDGSGLTLTATAGANHVTASGTLQSAWPLEGEFTFEGSGDHGARLAALAGLNLPGAGPSELGGEISIGEGRATIGIASLTIEHAAPAEGANSVVVGPLTGDIEVTRVGETFRAEGTLEAGRLDTSLLRQRQTVSQDSSPNRRSLIDYAVPMERFDRAAGRITLHAEELQHRNIILTDVTLPVTAADGVLSFDRAEAHYRGAPLELSFNADVEDQSVYLNLEMRDFDMGAFLDDLGRSRIVEGPAHIAIEGIGQGRTVRDVMASFTGQSNVSIGEGYIGRGGIDFLAADLLQAFFAEREQDRTALRCMVSRIDFERGTGQSRVFMADTNLITVTGRGRVFLGENRIDFLLAPRPKNPSLLRLAADYNVTGEILHPTIMPEGGSLIRGVATSVGGLALTGGAAALLPLLDMGDQVENACLDALAGAAPANVPAEE